MTSAVHFVEPAVARILIVEDDPPLSALLESGLRASGYATTLAEDGQTARRLGLTEDFDLLILDVGLREREGLPVLRELRAGGRRMPILVLSGRERDAAMCLESGADDHMRKPFRFDELIARVRTRLRKVVAEEHHVLSAGDLRLDLRTHRATVEGCTVDLTAREFSLLETFLRNADQVLSREQLLSHVWGYSFDPTTNLVNVYVNSLRKKLGSEVIETIRGVGYRLPGRSTA